MKNIVTWEETRMLTLEFFQEQAEYLARIILACICGGVIGIERQQRVKAAGTRTHMMLALATALMMIISKYGFSDVAGNPGMNLDVSRVAAGIISGIGILGGGIIFTGKRGNSSGITTAVGIWATIGIGMAVGAGMYVIGICTTIIIVILQWVLHKNLWIVKQPSRAQVSFRVEKEKHAYEKIVAELEQRNIAMSQFRWERKNNKAFLLCCQVIIPAGLSRDEIVAIFTDMEEVETFEVI